MKARLKLKLATAFSALGLLCSTASAEIIDLGPGTAVAINNNNEVLVIVGAESWLWRKGTLSPLTGQNIFNARDINDNGQIAGTSPVGSILFASLDGTPLGSLGGMPPSGPLASVAKALNNSGMVVGHSYIPSGQQHAFLYVGGQMQDICPGSARDINNTGTVVGYNGRPFIWQNGVTTTLSPFGSPQGSAEAINNSGQVTGWYHDPKRSVTHPFLFSNGTFIDVDTGKQSAAAWGINEAGTIVGTIQAHPCRQCLVENLAFIWWKGNFKLLTAWGWTLEWAFDINDGGVIVGSGSLNGQQRAFMLLP